MKRTAIWVVAVVALVGAGYFVFRSMTRSPAASGGFRTAPVQRTDISRTITATGTIVPEEVIDVGAQINGQVASFGKDADGRPLDYRSVVEEGAVLALIDEAIYAADVASAQAQLTEAQAQVGVANANRDQAKSRLEQTRRDWERAQRLGNNAALSKADYDAAQSNHEQAQAALAVAEANIVQAQAGVSRNQASLQRAQRNLNFCTIKSPVSGVIIDKRVDIGQTVVASLNAPSLFLIAKDLRKMLVLVQVNEADIGSIQPGQRVRFSADAYPGRPFRGEVRKVRLNASMTQNVVTYTVEITTDNTDLKLLPYLTANVRFEVARRDKVLAVPNAALRYTPKGVAEAAPADPPARTGGPRDESGERTGTIWALKGGQTQAIKVTPGLSDGTLTEVSGEGLDEGIEIVLGDQSSAAQAAPTGTTNPFAPPMMRGGGQGGGRRGGGGGR